MKDLPAKWTRFSNPPYKAVTPGNFESIPQIEALSREAKEAIKVISCVLPFKTNNYVVENLVNWSNPDDPLFVLNIPQKGMLKEHHYRQMADALRSGNRELISHTAHSIRMELNPHPAGQLELNVPYLNNGTRLNGVQHKYSQTVLFFPQQGQTCHAYCSFCFRWPQFVGMKGLKFASKEADLLVRYLKEHPEVSDVLFTGGDPMVMRARLLKSYIQPLLNAHLPNLRNIRIGTKTLSYWPYRYLTDPDAKEVLELFREIKKHRKHLAVMAHFNHARELNTPAVREAIERIKESGAQIRTQSPVLAHINDSAAAWRDLWKTQVKLGTFPYFVFLARDTGAQHYFGVPIARAWEIFSRAMDEVSGIERTMRGLSMSTGPGKVQIVGISEIMNRKVFVLRFLQGRKTEWTYSPFLAEFDEKALWLDDLKPAFGDVSFFFEDEYQRMIDAISHGVQQSTASHSSTVLRAVAVKKRQELQS